MSKCKVCEVHFKKRAGNQIYCSKECSGKGLFIGADFITCSNGLKVRSNYEKVFVEQMIKRNIKFEYEPRLPFDKRYSADFLVKDIYVEVWGVQNNKRYSERKVKKKKLYKKNKLKLFSVYPHDFTNIENKVDELKHLIS